MRPKPAPSSRPGLQRPLELARTHLANERTLLAYVRTAMALAAAAAALFHFFPLVGPLRVGAWILVLSGPLTLAVGLWRFFVVRLAVRGSGQ